VSLGRHRGLGERRRDPRRCRLIRVGIAALESDERVDADAQVHAHGIVDRYQSE
jgi:hypothetical protein